MTDDRITRLREAFRQASDLEGEARDAFLARLRSEDPALAAELQSLLTGSSGESDDFLNPLSPSAWLARRDRLPRGFRLDDFTIENEIGRGGMGVVYRAHQEGLDRDVAVKVLSPELELDPDVRARFLTEAKKVAKVGGHPGIVEVYASNEAEGYFYFAMQLIDGHGLNREIDIWRGLAGPERGILPSPRTPGWFRMVASFASKVARALDHVHTRGLIHRDVKPANILVTREGDPRVVDFGIARDASLGAITQGTRNLGTPLYMSPEQAEAVGERTIDARTDVYSLGVVLFEMLFRVRPFSGDTREEILANIRTGHRVQVDAEGECPKDLVRICEAAMALHVEDRYSTAAAMAADLDAFVDGRPVMPPAPSLLVKARRHLSRRRFVYGGAALLAGALFGALAYERRGTLPLSLSARDERTGRPLGGSVTVRAIRNVAGSFGPARSLGELPIGSLPLATRLEPGFYRFIVEFDDGRRREYFRRFGWDAAELYELRVGPDRSAAEDLRLIEGARDLLLPATPTNDHLCILARQRFDVEDFELATGEVSIGRYLEFLDATGTEDPAFWRGRRPEARYHDRPVSGVTWLQARAYAEWVGLRLPTHPEWALAARGTEGRPFPWGSEPGRGNAGRGPLHFNQLDHEVVRERVLEGLEPVDGRPEAASPQGVRHLFGNVEEWVETPIGSPPRSLDDLDPARFTFVGASFVTSSAQRGIDVSEHGYHTCDSSLPDLGFRCARSASTA